MAAPGKIANPKGWEPLTVSERYSVLDLLRGMSLSGVLVVNLLYFFRLPLFEHILHFHSHAGWLNHAIDLTVAELVEFKAFGLFSLTFGIGVAVQAERAAKRGVRVEIFLVRRLLILLAFGLAHLVLVSNVDILSLYAVCGLVLIPLLRLPTAGLLAAGLAAIYLPNVFFGWSHLPREALWPAEVAEATRVYGHGTFTAILEFRWRETQQYMGPLFFGVAQKTLGMMLVGAAVWRWGVIRDPQRYRRTLLAICLSAGLIGMVNTTAEVVSTSSGKSIAVPLIGLLGTNVPLAFVYAAAILAWRRSARVDALLAPFAAAGRMAFTNYLTQSFLFCLLFYGYGFGLFGRLDPQTALAIGVVFYAMQLAWSTWWLRRYRFGPFEWVWRSLTYGRRQGMR